MKALITGASSGIGLDMAKYLATKKIELFLVSRSKEKLESIQKELPTKVTVIVADLSSEQKVKELYAFVKKENIDILINNAGFGKFGNFTETNINDELEMIDLNIKAVHILTKLLLKDMEERNSGYILNVASSAAFQPGPSVLCPGPVDTNFNNVAGVKFGVKPMTSKKVAKYAIDKMFKNKLLIIPGFTMKLTRFFVRFIPNKLLLRMTYNIQKKKVN